ncbi:MAG TPA: acetate--CoA ligase [Chloroflexia bacterium]|nr:acetate--CoA ligase [Chloroflexia bacterium]
MTSTPDIGKQSVTRRPDFEQTDRVMHEDRMFTPSADVVENANITAYIRAKGFATYDELYAWSVAHPEEYWAEQAGELHWFRPWDTVFEWTEEPFFSWFAGGKFNVCYNCLDRHQGTPVWDRIAYYWEGEDPAETRTLTYAELHREVNRFAHALLDSGVKRGDRVTIYMSRCPELIVAMLAVARIGAVHSIIFGGFAAQAIIDRVADADARTIITIDGYPYNGKQLNLKAIVDHALEKLPDVERVIVVRRSGMDVTMKAGRDVYYHDLMAGVAVDAEVPCAEMDAEDPLYILYTSGSTGKPKGVIHVHGGYSVGCYVTTKFVFDIKPDDIYWCTADPGWVTGHSYIVYGPLMTGVSSLFYEGGTMIPDAGRWWSLVEKYKVTILYTAPTAIRGLMRHGEEFPARYDLGSLRLLGTVGEPINPEAWLWYRHVTGDRLPVMDTWWMTETGSMLISPTPITPLKPGSCTRPLPGIEADIVTLAGQPVDVEHGGFLVIRKPWPSMMRTIYKDPDRYRTYWNTIAGVYFAGDAAHQDRDGYLWVQGRVDDVIKVSGHRLGSMEIESSLVSHPAVAESAAIGLPDELTGEHIKVYVILRTGFTASDAMAAELKAHVRGEVGGVAVPKELEFVTSLPKTRSGKIMRRYLRALALGHDPGDITTLEG